MKMRKIFASVVASAVALSTMAVGVSAATITRNGDGTPTTTAVKPALFEAVTPLSIYLPSNAEILVGRVNINATFGKDMGAGEQFATYKGYGAASANFNGTSLSHNWGYGADGKAIVKTGVQSINATKFEDPDADGKFDTGAVIQAGVYSSFKITAAAYITHGAGSTSDIGNGMSDKNKDMEKYINKDAKPTITITLPSNARIGDSKGDFINGSDDGTGSTTDITLEMKYVGLGGENNISTDAGTTSTIDVTKGDARFTLAEKILLQNATAAEIVVTLKDKKPANGIGIATVVFNSDDKKKLTASVSTDQEKIVFSNIPLEYIYTGQDDYGYETYFANAKVTLPAAAADQKLTFSSVVLNVTVPDAGEATDPGEDDTDDGEDDGDDLVTDGEDDGDDFWGDDGEDDGDDFWGDDGEDDGDDIIDGDDTTDTNDGDDITDGDDDNNAGTDTDADNNTGSSTTDNKGTNPNTGVAVAAIPALIAGIATVIARKRK